MILLIFLKSDIKVKILKFVNAFLLFCNDLPFEKGFDLHIMKLNPMLCSKFGWKCLRDSEEEDFKKFSIMYFYYFAIFSTLRRARLLFELNWTIYTQGYFVPRLIDNGPMVLKNIFKSTQCIFTIFLLSPLWEGCGPPFEQTWIPFANATLCRVCFHWPGGSEIVLVDF